MILIPIGHDQATVRRLPWISFGLIAACLLGLIVSGAASGESRHDRAAARDLERVFDYYLEHPYLELDDEIGAFFEDAAGDVPFQTLMQAFTDSRGLPDAEERRAEQEHLDGLVAQAKKSLNGHPYLNFGWIPGRPDLVSLFTHMFLHAGWMHLIGNMLILYLAGPYIEDVWGRPLFLALYLASGLAAALGFAAMHPASTIPMVGASGAIAGLMGAFLVRYWSTRIRFFYMVGLLFRGTFSAPAWVMLPMWLGQQLFMVSVLPDAGERGGVAYWAHIGGFLFGAAVATGIRSQRIEQRYLAPALERKVTETVLENTLVEEALAAHAAGRHEDSSRTLAEHLSGQPGDADAVAAYWSVMLDMGCPQRAEGEMLALIRHQLQRGEPRVALDNWDELTRYLPEPTIESALSLKLARALAAADRREDAARRLRGVLLDASRVAPAVLLQVARLGSRVDPRIAEAATAVALARVDLDPEIRAELERSRPRTLAVP